MQVNQLEAYGYGVQAWATGENYLTFSLAANGLMARHLETTNILYCDGHVKAVKLNSLTRISTTAPTGNGYYSSDFTVQND